MYLGVDPVQACQQPGKIRGGSYIHLSRNP